MNTTEFFRKILPSGGFKVLAELVAIPGREKPGWKYHKYESHEAAALAAQQLDAAGRVIYHACNSYGDWYEDSKTGKKRLRTQVNVVACRSLYDDVDVAKDGCYADRKEAGAALKKFLEASGMPKPMVVFSGGGLHLYWPLTADIDRATWDRLASKKRLITKHFGLKVDSAVDTDSARVLRPVGTTWRKFGQARPVETKVDADPTDAVELEALMDSVIERCGLSKFDVALTVPDFVKAVIDNSDLGVAMEFPPSYAEIVANHCNQIKLFKAQGGESEPVWRASLGVLVHCKDGVEKAHEWSSKYPTYDRLETQTKLDNWATGPTTCANFRELNSEGCMGCAHTCKSPIQLGLDVEEKPPVIAAPVVVEDALVETTVVAPEEALTWEHCWPEKFGYDKATETIWTKILDGEGVAIRVNVATPMFYPLHQVVMEDGTLSFLVRMHVRGNHTREFEIPLKFLQDEKALAMQLASRQIHCYNRKLVQAFMSEYMVQQRKKMEEKLTYRQFGWQQDFQGFLIGSSLITEHGVTTVTPADSIPASLQSAHAMKGTAAQWSNAANTLYNVKNGEPYQFVIATVFGAILNPLLDYSEWNGIPLAVTSDDSAYGKTTISKIALNMYCPADRTIIADITPKGIPARCSSMNHLPYLLDEMTKSLADPIAMSDVLYTLSNGRPRIGLTTSGVERKANASWSCTPIITGNRNILHALTESKINPEATQLRVFEIDLMSYPKLEAIDDSSPDKIAHSAIAQDAISNCYGTVGAEWIRFVIRNREEVQARLRKVSMALPLLVGGNSSKERFYLHMMACSLVGAYYAKKLGFIDYDVTKLRDWAVGHMTRMRDTSRNLNVTAMDHFLAMLSDMHGRLIVTKGFDTLDARSGKVEASIVDLRGSGADGRMITGKDGERPRLYITVRAFDKWCNEHDLQSTKIKRDLLRDNILRTGTPGCNLKTGAVRVTIGRGIPGVAFGSPWCYEFDYEAARGSEMANGIIEVATAEKAA